jgi:hypothetical protein
MLLTTTAAGYSSYPFARNNLAHTKDQTLSFVHMGEPRLAPTVFDMNASEIRAAFNKKKH